MKRLLLSLLCIAAFAASARAEETPQRVVDEALATYRNMTTDPDFANLNSLLARAKAVVIVPEMIKGGFIIGGEWGQGVMLARDAASGAWSQPAFVTLASGSIGLQIGGSVSQVVLVVMTDTGLDAMLQDKVTLGGEASVAAGPVGAGVNAQSTSDVNDDVYAYAKSQGLFAGAAIEGAVLEADPDRNRFYYGGEFSTRQIVFGQATPNAGADALRAALAAR
jgi:lipid-binding SYLF domain-containing protein